MIGNIQYLTQLATPRIKITGVSSSGVTGSINTSIPNAIGYTIMRGLVGDFSAGLYMFDISGTTFNDTTVLPSVNYYWTSSATSPAYQTSFEGQVVNVVTGSIIGSGGTLTAPVLSLVTNTSTGVTTSWSAITNATGYWIQRSNVSDYSSLPQTFYVSGATGTITYADTGTGTIYLRVFATNPGNYTDSAWSNSIIETTP